MANNNVSEASPEIKTRIETAEERYARRVAQYNAMSVTPDRPLPPIVEMVNEAYAALNR